MRGQEKKQTSMLVLRSPEDFEPKQHPIRRIKKMADEILQSLSPTLEAMYRRSLQEARRHAARRQNLERNGGSAVDGRTTRPGGYVVSQRIRKRVEEIFGWGKTVGNFRKTRLVGLAKNKLAGFMVGAAYNLVRLAKLLPLPEPA